MRESDNQTEVIILTAYPDVPSIREALADLRARDYLVKNPEGGFDTQTLADLRRKAREAIESSIRKRATSGRDEPVAQERPFAFVLMPFAREYEEIYLQVVKPAVETNGLLCVRADDLFEPRRILDDIKQCIDQAKFIVADLSERNSNVFYEVGMAHAVGQAVLLLTQNMEDIPPKLRDLRCILYQDSLEGAVELRDALCKSIRRLRRVRYSFGPLFQRGEYEINPDLCIALVPSIDPGRSVLDQIVQPTASDCGLVCISAESMYSARHHMDEIWEHLNRARVVVADLSDRDPDVFYLTGICHGLKKDVILLARSEDDIPFDLKGPSHIVYSIDSLREGLEAKQQLLAAMKHVLGRKGRLTTRGDRRKIPIGPSAQSTRRGADAEQQKMLVPDESEILTWLHLSDLHYEDTTQREYQVGQIVQALVDDLVTLQEERNGLVPDVVFFTGDLASKAKAKEYTKAWDLCFGQILDACGLQPRNLFIVPGNHDVDRMRTTMLDAGIVQGLHDASQVQALLHDPNWEGYRKQLLQRMEIFCDAMGSVVDLPFEAKSLSWGRTLRTRGKLRVGVIGLNSAWTSAAVRGWDGDVDDRGKLIVGKPLVQAAIEQFEKQKSVPDVTIALLHHPIGWLQEWDQQDIEQMFGGICRFVLHGHVHRTSISFLGTPGPTTMVVSAGALFKEYLRGQGHTCLHAYNIVQLDLAKQQGTIFLRRFDPISQRYGIDDTTLRHVRNGQFLFRYGRDGFSVNDSH